MSYAILTVQINVEGNLSELVKFGSGEDYQPILVKSTLSKHFQRKFPNRKIVVQICDIDPVNEEEYNNRNIELFKIRSLN